MKKQKVDVVVGHWGIYDIGTTLDRYRYCYACKEWRRNRLLRDNKPLIHKGRKP